MGLTKCPKCGLQFRYGTEPVGIDNNGIPVYQRFGYCDTCKSKYNLDALGTRGVETVVKEERKNSSLSIWAIVLSLFVITSFISVILSLIDLCMMNKEEKHHWSCIALTISVLTLICFFGFNDKTETSELGTIEFSAESEETSELKEINDKNDAEYIICTVDEMVKLLEQNAMRAEKEYSNKYIEVTGNQRKENVDAEKAV